MRTILKPGTLVRYWLIDKIGTIERYIKSEDLYIVNFDDNTSLFLQPNSIEEII